MKRKRYSVDNDYSILMEREVSPQTGSILISVPGIDYSALRTRPDIICGRDHFFPDREKLGDSVEQCHMNQNT